MQIPQIKTLHCLRCHHTWYPRRLATPKRCPKCSTVQWNVQYSRMELVNDSILSRMQKCPNSICYQHHAVISTKIKGRLALSHMVSAPTMKLVKSKNNRRRRRHRRFITKDTLPEGFTRIGSKQ